MGTIQQLSIVCRMCCVCIAGTPEGSMGGNISDPVKQELAAEFATAHAALKATPGLGDSTSLATCGWGVGPSNDRTFFDDAVAPDVPVASLDPNGA